MFGFNLFSSKKESAPEATWDANTATVQNQQPTSPEAPSTERVITEQPVRLPLLSLSLYSMLSTQY